jgi:hypothetical protein
MYRHYSTCEVCVSSVLVKSPLLPHFFHSPSSYVHHLLPSNTLLPTHVV